MPIASLAVEGERAEIDSSYIPPVTRLSFIDLFDTCVVGSLVKLLEELFDASSDKLAAGGYVFSDESLGAEMRVRYNYYHVLNAMLLGKSGMLRNLADLSPVKFLYDLMHPLSR